MAQDVNSVSVMSFNVWSAEDSASGRAGIISAVQSGQAGIVGFQEMGGGQGPTIANALGMEYDSGSSIASLYPIVDTSFSYGVRLALAPGREAYAFNVHLTHAPYGPYQLAGIPYFGGALYDPNNPSHIDAVVQDQIDARGGELNTLLNEMQSAIASGLPVFLTGDFNEAPHLDWTAAAATAGVHSAEVPWPTSMAVQSAGLTDSFRDVHADEVTKPGNTWSPVFGPDYINEGVNEPQDRIDFVYYAGESVTTVASQTVRPGRRFFGHRSSWIPLRSSRRGFGILAPFLPDGAGRPGQQLPTRCCRLADLPRESTCRFVWPNCRRGCSARRLEWRLSQQPCRLRAVQVSIRFDQRCRVVRHHAFERTRADFDWSCASRLRSPSGCAK